jgi:hypothetical protein
MDDWRKDPQDLGDDDHDYHRGWRRHDHLGVYVYDPSCCCCCWLVNTRLSNPKYDDDDDDDEASGFLSCSSG